MKEIQSINVSRHDSGLYSVRIRLMDEHGQITYVQRPSAQNSTLVSIEELLEIINTCTDE